MSKKEAKKEIKKLVAKYKRLKPAQIKKYNEMTTRKDFVLPLFGTLGWDIKNNFTTNEVVEEEPVVRGTVDYSFRLNNIPQFLLEAKALKIDLDKIEWSKQAVTYGWNMGMDWVILTDFEGLKLFNAEEKTDIPRPILELTYEEYLTKFNDLWLLSKESFQKGELDKQVERFGIKIKRVEVTERLAKDLVDWREKLFDNFSKWNEDRPEEEIDEAVQRILDRFIFIRSCEDRKIEDKILWQAFQKWDQERKDDNFIKTLKPIFKKFDEKYNSNLFRPHFCEEFETEGGPFSDVIKGLYSDKEAGVKYNFAAIKPDVLGAVYEQYLGHLLEKAKKGKVAKEKAKRKKQGIYYTPTSVVDYIVQNTVGELIKEKKNLAEIESLKILDPACGSGSFLIKAFDVLDKELKELRSSSTSTEHAHRKYRILINNLYGVDLDEQAIEITRLNLLLKAIEPGHRLPLLSENIKVGNSLISGTEKELKKYFDRNWKKKKALNWEEEFPKTFKDKNPGFDVVVGNPPYIDSEEMTKNQPRDRDYMVKNYDCAVGNWDLFVVFIEKALKLLRNGGYLGFIVPNKLLSARYAEALRKWINNNFELVKIVDLSRESVFKVDVYPVIIIVRKRKQTVSIKISRVIGDKGEIKIDANKREIDWALYLCEDDGLLKKFNKFKKLSDLYFVNAAATVSEAYQIVQNIVDDKSVEGFKIINTGTIDPYVNLWGYKKMRYIKESYLYPVIKKKFLKTKDWHNEQKIMVAGMSKRIEACLDKKREYLPVKSTTVITKKKKDQNLIFLLALLNSRLLSFIFKIQNLSSGMAGGYMNVNKNNLGKLPIAEVTLKQKTDLVKISEKMINLNVQLKRATEKSDKWYKIKKEIERTDKIIDQKVYKLYNLTTEEIKIIEQNNE